jgi:hypothetical protein
MNVGGAFACAKNCYFWLCRNIENREKPRVFCKNHAISVQNKSIFTGLNFGLLLFRAPLAELPRRRNR